MQQSTITTIYAASLVPNVRLRCASAAISKCINQFLRATHVLQLWELFGAMTHVRSIKKRWAVLPSAASTCNFTQMQLQQVHKVHHRRVRTLREREKRVGFHSVFTSSFMTTGSCHSTAVAMKRSDHSFIHQSSYKEGGISRKYPGVQIASYHIFYVWTETEICTDI